MCSSSSDVDDDWGVCAGGVCAAVDVDVMCRRAVKSDSRSGSGGCREREEGKAITEAGDNDDVSIANCRAQAGRRHAVATQRFILYSLCFEYSNNINNYE